MEAGVGLVLYQLACLHMRVAKGRYCARMSSRVQLCYIVQQSEIGCKAQNLTAATPDYPGPLPVNITAADRGLYS